MANVLPQNHPNIWTLIGGFVQLEHLSRSDDHAVHQGIAVNNPARWKTVANKTVRRLTNLLVRDEFAPVRILHKVSWVNQGALSHGMKTDRDSSSDSSDDD
ncbi:General transcription factor IIF subunit 2 [Frankliniella fusca]|uniref:General transcription factor IIF subunit 2 n=1 Tax=Frankliniella fusca TaxID=407009 RepID=A0AAE1HFD5_9NEOP|nr:General transcription factor IIF subunit 2 [Frankliniella fusca]